MHKERFGVFTVNHNENQIFSYFAHTAAMCNGPKLLVDSTYNCLWPCVVNFRYFALLKLSWTLTQ